MTETFYVTTPIYYVNDVPHLGHAYTSIAADALRRYHLLRGREARLLTGTDEHGLKIEREAKERGIEPAAFAEQMSRRFRDAWGPLEVVPDDFIRTTEPRHIALVQEIWRKVAAKGDLYKDTYEDWYCVGCESFKTEKELLPGNVCPLHNKPVERLKEESYFFRLSKYEKPLLELFERPGFVEPESRKNEVVSFVKGGLRDLSVSRTSFTWGVPVPDDPKHVMYVWFDALANYWTALGGEESRLLRFWPPEGKAVHLVGKDILRFHAVYWPAFLLSAGLEPPSKVYAHGFLTVDGQKMSKTLRNAVDPLRIAATLGPDVLRYQLLRAIAFGQDGDFDHAAMIERYNADLGKNLGNLLSRTLGLCSKWTGGKTPGWGNETQLDTNLLMVAIDKARDAALAWDALQPHRALETTWEICSAANQYVDRAAPWTAAKEGDQTRLETILATLLTVLRGVSVMIWPAMPSKSDEMRKQLGLPPVEPKLDRSGWPTAFTHVARGHDLAPGGPLFPTFDEDRTKAILAELVPKPESPASPSPSPPPAPAPPPTPPTSISYDQFTAVDLRVGVVKSCEKVPRKDKLLKLLVDIGEPEPRAIVAGLALSFPPEALVGRRVVVVANLAPREFGKGLVSHGMILATGPSEALKLATVEGDAPPGLRLK